MNLQAFVVLLIFYTVPVATMQGDVKLRASSSFDQVEIKRSKSTHQDTLSVQAYLFGRNHSCAKALEQLQETEPSLLHLSAYPRKIVIEYLGEPDHLNTTEPCTNKTYQELIKLSQEKKVPFIIVRIITGDNQEHIHYFDAHSFNKNIFCRKKGEYPMPLNNCNLFLRDLHHRGDAGYKNPFNQKELQRQHIQYFMQSAVTGKTYYLCSHADIFSKGTKTNFLLKLFYLNDMRNNLLEPTNKFINRMLEKARALKTKTLIKSSHAQPDAPPASPDLYPIPEDTYDFEDLLLEGSGWSPRRNYRNESRRRATFKFG